MRTWNCEDHPDARLDRRDKGLARHVRTLRQQPAYTALTPHTFTSSAILYDSALVVFGIVWRSVVDQIKKRLAKYKEPLAEAQPYHVAANTGGAAGADAKHSAGAPPTAHQRYGDRGSGDDDDSAGSLLKDYLTE